MPTTLGAGEFLQVNPVYDAIFKCPLCEFSSSGPDALDAHRLTHKVIMEVVNGVPVHEIAGPLQDAQPVIPPRTYTCSTCGEKIEGYGAFMTHKKQEKKR